MHKGTLRPPSKPRQILPDPTKSCQPLWSRLDPRALACITLLLVSSKPCAADSLNFPTFTDRRQAAGITFRHHGNPTPDKYLIETMGGGVAVIDFDNDGLLDLFFVNSGGLVKTDAGVQVNRSKPRYFNRLYRNNGDGSFQDATEKAGLSGAQSSLYGMGVATGDYDNDGRPDVFITNLSKELYALYRNGGDGLFSYITRPSYLARITTFMSGWGTRFADLDLDGWKDLFVAQSHVLDNVDRIDSALSYRQAPLLARNVNGKFVDVSSQGGPVFLNDYAGRGAAFGDLDNDGDIDIVMAVLNDFPLVLYSNASEAGNHWLQVKLTGTKSNRDGQGATIKLRAGGELQWSYATTAGSYLSASDARVHFGLGGSDVVEWMEVLWPSGAKQTLTDLRADQIVAVNEP